MKHFVLAALLTILLAATGCVGYRPATSPYYTSYYNTYDAFNNCYYHPGYYGGYGYRHRHHHDGIDGRNRWNGGGQSGNFQATSHDSRWHGGGSHPGGRGSGGGGHTSSSSSHSGGGGHHSSGSSHSSSSHSSGGGHK